MARWEKTQRNINIAKSILAWLCAVSLRKERATMFFVATIEPTGPMYAKVPANASENCMMRRALIVWFSFKNVFKSVSPYQFFSCSFDGKGQGQWQEKKGRERTGRRTWRGGECVEYDGICTMGFLGLSGLWHFFLRHGRIFCKMVSLVWTCLNHPLLSAAI